MKNRDFPHPAAARSRFHTPRAAQTIIGFGASVSCVVIEHRRYNATNRVGPDYVLSARPHRSRLVDACS